MSSHRRMFSQALLCGALISACFGVSLSAQAATAEDLNRDAAHTLQTLYKLNKTAELLSRKAKGILVFPKIVKAGLVFGGSYGEGVLMQGGNVSQYYNSVSASWGWQAGAETYAFITDQQGLMGNLSIEGTKISRIKR